jgi:hypothetical protein
MSKYDYKTTRKTFDFEQYPEARAYLEKQPNMTKYIVDLIERDMKKEIPSINKEEIFAIIEEYLQTHNIIVDNKTDDISVDDSKMKDAALKILGKK